MRVFLSLVTVTLLVSCTTQGTLGELASKRPDPSLTPGEVVQIQMNAFQNNDAEDRGIEIAFRFASPANKQLTGPLSRFARMMRTVLYEPMLLADEVNISEAEVQGSLARVFVSVRTPEGNQYDYVFFLARQSQGEFVDCWMTEGVSVLEQPGTGGGTTVI